VNPIQGQDGRIVVDELSKVFGGKIRAVDQLSFTVEPGSVTGFLGPNGAGKTTTLRMLLGLVAPTSGRATIGGLEYRHIHHPLNVVGAGLESSGFHPARTGRNHLLIQCRAAGFPDGNADNALSLVGLGDAGKRKVRGYSLGMKQRLALATALLGDPRVLILDEPANGLDPDGIRWQRGFFRHLADQGRTVLVSSHQLNEVQEIADRVVILNHGRLVRSGSLAELRAGSDAVQVRTPNPQPLADGVAQAGAHFAQTGPDTYRVSGIPVAHVGHIAFTRGVELHELQTVSFNLEQLFFALTQGGSGGSGQPPPPGGQPGPAGQATDPGGNR
jgi:ABC-2 type transport system ATP-binding protein